MIEAIHITNYYQYYTTVTTTLVIYALSHGPMGRGDCPHDRLSRVVRTSHASYVLFVFHFLLYVFLYFIIKSHALLHETVFYLFK